MIDAAVVQRLIEIGDDIVRGVPVRAQDFEDLRDKDKINRTAAGKRTPEYSATRSGVL